MGVGFDASAFENTAFATDPFVIPAPSFTGKRPAPRVMTGQVFAQQIVTLQREAAQIYTLKAPSHPIMTGKREENVVTARRP